jgi:hypothetical protein
VATDVVEQAERDVRDVRLPTLAASANGGGGRAQGDSHLAYAIRAYTAHRYIDPDMTPPASRRMLAAAVIKRRGFVVRNVGAPEQR